MEGDDVTDFEHMMGWQMTGIVYKAYFKNSQNGVNFLGMITNGRGTYLENARVRPGIYQRQVTGKGHKKRWNPYYKPYDPKTPAEQANRNRFRLCMEAWNALTPEAKADYNKRARIRGLHGNNLFVKWNIHNF